MEENFLASILSDEQIAAFKAQGVIVDDEQGTPPPEGSNGEEPQNIIPENPTAEDLFPDEGSEIVGKEKKEQQREENTPPAEKGDGTSPKHELYSSFAGALKVDGVFSHLADEDIEGISDADTFLEAMHKQVDAMLDEDVRRVKQALNDGMKPSEIQVYESSIKNLNAVTEEQLTDESEAGVALRDNLIYHSFINQGMSKERAEKMTKRIIGSESEIDDAKEALQSMKDFYTSKYTEARDKAHKETEKLKADQKKEAEALKKAILTDENGFNGIKVDTKTRQLIYDAITKPVAKDADGRPLTALEQYANEHKAEFQKGVAYAYILTNGFKDLGALAKPVEKQAKAKGLRDLEDIINGTMRNPDGSLRLVGGNSDDDTEGWSISV